MGLGVITGQAVANQGVFLAARLRGATGVLVTQASLAAVLYTASDLTAGVQLGTGSFPIASSVFDALQQSDPRWTKDSAAYPGPDGAWGYNFAQVLPAALLPITALVPGQPPPAPHRVQVDVTFTPVSGQPVRVVFAFTPVPVFG